VASEVFLQAGSPLLIPTKDLAPGTYVVRVRAFASDQALGGEAARSAPVVFAPPSGMDVFMRQLRDSPILLIVLVGLVLLALVILVAVNVMSRNRSNRADKVVEAALPVNPRRSAPMSAEPQVAAVPQFPPPPPPGSPAGYAPPSGYASAPPAFPAAPPMPPPPAVGQPMAMLMLRVPASPPWEGRITQASYTLGRAADNNGVLPGFDPAGGPAEDPGHGDPRPGMSPPCAVVRGVVVARDGRSSLRLAVQRQRAEQHGRRGVGVHERAPDLRPRRGRS